MYIKFKDAGRSKDPRLSNNKIFCPLAILSERGRGKIHSVSLAVIMLNLAKKNKTAALANVADSALDHGVR